MKKQRSARLAVIGLAAAVSVFVASCTTPTPPPAPVNWSFRASSITVVDSADEIREPFFDNCINPAGCSDEPYVINVWFRVRIGDPGSAAAGVEVADPMPSTDEGQTRTPTGGQRGLVNFAGIQPLDVLTALNPSNKLEVFGVYTWAVENNVVSALGGPASDVAERLRQMLNNTLAASTVPTGDTDSLISLIVGNIGSAFGLLLANLPCPFICDEVLGGALYVGIGANGTLGALIDSSIASGQPVPSIAFPGTVPPDIEGGAIFTLTGAKSFTKSFSGAGGTHRWTFTAGPA